MKKNNIDKQVVEDFGREWKVFNHNKVDSAELDSAFKILSLQNILYSQKPHHNHADKENPNNPLTKISWK